LHPVEVLNLMHALAVFIKNSRAYNIGFFRPLKTYYEPMLEVLEN
jgi:hypothetical protein